MKKTPIPANNLPDRLKHASDVHALSPDTVEMLLTQAERKAWMIARELNGTERRFDAQRREAVSTGGPNETFARVTAPPEVAHAMDAVLEVPSYVSLGFLRPGPDVWFGSSERAFGAPGAGGSFGFGDPGARLGYAYVMNRLDFYLQDDPREKALRDAVYRAIARHNEQSAGRLEAAASAPTAAV